MRRVGFVFDERSLAHDTGAMQLGEPAMVELTTYIALANLYSRSNVAMGIESQGFSTVCEVKLARQDVASR